MAKDLSEIKQKSYWREFRATKISLILPLGISLIFFHLPVLCFSIYFWHLTFHPYPDSSAPFLTSRHQCFLIFIFLSYLTKKVTNSILALSFHPYCGKWKQLWLIWICTNQDKKNDYTSEWVSEGQKRSWRSIALNNCRLNCINVIQSYEILTDIGRCLNEIS